MVPIFLMMIRFFLFCFVFLLSVKIFGQFIFTES
uniref:Uncharacterized protein n=1 Tax=Anguilla anguilla TaxID=7936 RepID=A0A0E9SCI0_ANGAN